MKKESIGCVIPVVLLAGLFVWDYYRRAEEREKREARERQRTTEVESRKAEETRRMERVDQAFRDLAKRHNAAVDCPGVPQTQFGDGFYTLQLQDALQKHGDKAIFLCRIDDVFKMGDGFRIVSRYIGRFGGRDMTFLLEVDEATARHLVEVHKPDYLCRPQAFAVAVVVKRVTVTLRREYRGVGGTVEAGTYESDHKTEVEIVEEGGMFPQIVISGKCLEIIPLEGETVF